ncbi:ABC transporter permease [Micromonospora sp. WMMD1082]|uniref:ABC transporter permease n=1 Tax=Micromonospora sp. WMMD1082 TaxID=3016104 RepID=UPI002416EE79|nr:ABC transporter permease [Micromonospora sp. WMMD1082]MDG4792763.1 ABC transporter permease [Micromonospora sp. WMMD1082]
MTTTGRTVRPSVSRTFVSILGRDLYVTGRGLGVFFAQNAIQPLLMLFIFGEVLGRIGYVSADYGRVLLPGILAITTFLTALQSVAFPLSLDLGATKEIEDRLLAPLPTYLVAVEKMLVGTIKGIGTTIITVPIGMLMLTSAPWRTAGIPMLVVFLVVGGWVGSAIGLTMGTVMMPSQINIVFALVLTPLMFTGAIQYPWQSLSAMPWFQLVTGINPLTYLAEGARSAVVPDIPHIAPWICIAALLAAGTLFSTIGIKGFLRRAID